MCGTRFYINCRSYSAAVLKYGKKLVNDIETAAELAGMESCREYTFTELVRGALGKYREHPALLRTVEQIEKEPPCFMHGRLDILHKHFDAANAVVYFRHA